MRRIRYLLPFLLLAGAVGAQAQPIVMINPGANECDVTPSSSEIFHLDTSGNVLITGTLSGTGCGGGGTTASTTFTPVNAAPLAVSPTSFNAGTSTSPTSAAVTYTAAYATGCSVSASAGTVTGGSGTCPAVSLSNTSCTGSNNSCSGSGSVSEPTAFGANLTKCDYTLTATCSPGSVTSSTTVSVVASGGGGGDTGVPAVCQTLHTIGTGGSGTWARVQPTTTVLYNTSGSSRTGVDATSYNDIWTPPGVSTISWPGNNITTRPTASVNQYFSEKFVADPAVTTHPHWAYTNSGSNSNMSMTVSICPGDFGQTGTQVQPYCSVNMGKSSNGLTVMVTSTPVAGYCSLTPNTTYYFNLLPMANLPVSNVSTSSCSGTCQPWLSMTQ